MEEPGRKNTDEHNTSQGCHLAGWRSITFIILARTLSGYRLGSHLFCTSSPVLCPAIPGSQYVTFDLFSIFPDIHLRLLHHTWDVYISAWFHKAALHNLPTVVILSTVTLVTFQANRCLNDSDEYWNHQDHIGSIHDEN